MSKISTSDCVKALVEKMPTSKPSDWKRRSKSRWYDCIRRIFENTRTNESWEVYEKDGAISGMQVHDPNADVVNTPGGARSGNPQQTRWCGSIYYVIARSKEEGETPTILLYVSDAKEFDREGHQSDETPDGAFEELKRMGFDGTEVMESVIELSAIVNGKPQFDFSDPNWAKNIDQPWPPVDVEDLKKKMASSQVFKHSEAFLDFMREHLMDEEIV